MVGRGSTLSALALGLLLVLAPAHAATRTRTRPAAAPPVTVTVTVTRTVTVTSCPLTQPSPTPSTSRPPATRTGTSTSTSTAVPSPTKSRSKTPGPAPSPGAGGNPVPGAPNCPIFPANNPWNLPVTGLPVASNSATLINSIGSTRTLHPDFGSGLWDGYPIGIPFNVVNSSTRYVTVDAGDFNYGDESDLGLYPLPDVINFEAPGDHHAIFVDSDTCMLYELWAAYVEGSGANAVWSAGCGADWSLNSNALRPDGWTSADAAGLPILPGLVRYDEVAAGRINHALRFTVASTRKAYVWPARHYASSNTSPSLPPMGARLRLKASYDISSAPPQAKVVLQAMKEFGMILADNGSNWFVSGVPDERWDNDDLRALKSVPGSAFEVVDTSSMPGWQPGVFA